VSKPTASRGWIRALCIVPVLAIVAIALLVLSPPRHHNAAASAAATASTASLASQPGTVTPAARGRIQASFAALPLAFERNQGQTDAQVKYMARGNGYTLFLTANDAVFSLHSQSAKSEPSAVRRAPELRAKSHQRHAQKDSAAVVRMQLVGGNSLAKVAASAQLPGTTNYFLGNDPGKWHRDVARYARVSYQDVYPGVNLAFHGAQRQLEFDFVVAPGANPEPIGFRFTGAQGMKTDDSGNLVISSAAGDVLLRKPVAYQERSGARQAVDARFVLKSNNHVSFELGNYDRRRELVIDPSVTYAYSTYLGGALEDDGYGIAVDGSGNAHVTGQTASIDFPVHLGVPPNTNAGSFDVFVTEIAANGSLVYSTYVGGSGDDSGNAIAVDASGNTFVAGGTTSTDFPATAGAFQIALAAGATGNAFVFELSASGATLTYCTYLGGNRDDVAFGIALDSAVPPNVYAVGSTSSTNFPAKNPLQSSVGGGFVTKLNSSGSALLYSTYLGGSGDSVNAVAVAPASPNNAYVTGATTSASFHTTPGAFQTTYGGISDAFVTVINPAGSAYVYSTFLGGSGFDAGDGIAVDSSGNAYVTGETQSSTDFHTTTGALQATFGGGTSDAFVTKLSPSGTGASDLVYSTFLGGELADFGASIAVDGSNNAYVTGQTNSTKFPTVIPTQSALGGGNDAFVSEINPAGSQLVFSTYLGGSADEDDGGKSGAIAVDGAANIYVTGNTASTSTDSPPFPTQNPLQATNKGSNDAFVVKYAQSSAASTFSLSATPLSPSSVDPGGSATSTVTVTPPNGFNGSVTITCAISPMVSLGPACGAVSATSTAPATLTVSTTAASALLHHPANARLSGLFYALFLPIGGVALMGLGLGSAGLPRKKLFGFLLVGLLLSGLILMPACGGGSGGGGGGGTGTPAGTYTITVSGTATGATQTGPSPALTLIVN
jgi:Beta-propeller repeat